MKNLMKLFALSFLTISLFSACSKDDDPADNDLFVGTYKGNISYTSGSESKSNEDGTVRVIKTGNNYYFAFSDAIPDLKGVEFQRDENSVFSVGTGESKAIRITANSLTIAFSKDGQVWTANATR